jgi:hypothetical protein
MSRVIISNILSEITVPKSALKGIFSFFDSTPHRTNSPIRGTAVFARYPIITAKNVVETLVL